jgi:hypothetical protein
MVIFHQPIAETSGIGRITGRFRSRNAPEDPTRRNCRNADTLRTRRNVKLGSSRQAKRAKMAIAASGGIAGRGGGRIKMGKETAREVDPFE